MSTYRTVYELKASGMAAGGVVRVNRSTLAGLDLRLDVDVDGDGAADHGSIYLTPDEAIRLGRELIAAVAHITAPEAPPIPTLTRQYAPTHDLALRDLRLAATEAINADADTRAIVEKVLLGIRGLDLTGPRERTEAKAIAALIDRVDEEPKP